jgi:succinate dehydrogenase flavin-adding protein (antitoxin of CptAB toxin-antitoxin module)
MRELDLLLEAFLARGLESLDDEQVRRLETLLGHPDPEILAWLTGGSPAPESLAPIVERIRKSLD